MRRRKILGGGNGRSPLLSDPKKPETIKEALIKHAKQNVLPEARVVKISRLGKTGMPTYAQEVDIAWVDENKASMEAAVRDLMGGGKFRLQFQNDATTRTWAYDFNVEGPNRGQKEVAEGEDGKPKPQNKEDRYMALVDKLVDTTLGQRTSSTAEAIELAKVMKGDGGADEFLKEIAVSGYNNMLSQKEMGFDNAVKMLEFLRTMQPTVEKEEPLIAIVQSLVPLIGQIIAARQGIGPQLSPAQLQQAQGQLQQLQQHMPGLGQNVPTAGPGEPAQAPPVAQDTVPSTPPASALDLMLAEFRRDVAADAEIPVLALALHQMVARAEYMAGIGTPHPMFTGLINQTDPMRLSHEFDRFTAAIPEFKQKADTAAAIKAAIAASYMPVPEPAEEPQQPPAPRAGDTVGQDDAANHLDTAGQTPGPEQPGTDDAAHADRPDGPAIIRQPPEDDNAPAQI